MELTWHQTIIVLVGFLTVYVVLIIVVKLLVPAFEETKISFAKSTSQLPFQHNNLKPIYLAFDGAEFKAPIIDVFCQQRSSNSDNPSVPEVVIEKPSAPAFEEANQSSTPTVFGAFGLTPSTFQLKHIIPVIYGAEFTTSIVDV